MTSNNINIVSFLAVFNSTFFSEFLGKEVNYKYTFNLYILPLGDGFVIAKEADSLTKEYWSNFYFYGEDGFNFKLHKMKKFKTYQLARNRVRGLYAMWLADNRLKFEETPLKEEVYDWNF